VAASLKTFFSRSRVEAVAASIARVYPKFERSAFVRDAVHGLEDLELIARGRHIAEALRAHLPSDYEAAIDVILRSLGPRHATDELEGVGMAPFFYLPHVTFVALYGLEDFDVSMRAQYELTQRFTCEFSIRPFLERYPDRTLAKLTEWARDSKPHVRRLASEGTRPRLPWATRVRWLEREPKRLLPLLELLKDDPSSLVRRSVANHVNDLSRAHPELANDLAERWWKDATPERRALVKHALRSAVKRGDRRALRLLGFGKAPKIAIVTRSFSPKAVAIGETVRIAFTLRGASRSAQTLAVDLVVHFTKARGKTSPKVFKVKTLTLARGGEVSLGKSISLAVHTTRKPYPGRHNVEIAVNGERTALGHFDVRA